MTFNQEEQEFYQELKTHLDNINSCDIKERRLTSLKLVLEPKDLSLDQQGAISSWKSQNIPLFRAVTQLRGAIHDGGWQDVARKIKSDVVGSISELEKEAVKPELIPEMRIKTITGLAQTMSAYLFEQSLVAIKYVSGVSDSKSAAIFQSAIDKSIIGGLKSVSKNLFNNQLDPAASLKGASIAAIGGAAAGIALGGAENSSTLTNMKNAALAAGAAAIAKNASLSSKPIVVGAAAGIVAAAVTGVGSFVGVNKKNTKEAASALSKAALASAEVLYDASDFPKALTKAAINGLSKGLEKAVYDQAWNFFDGKKEMESGEIFDKKIATTFGSVSSSYIISLVLPRVIKGMKSYFEQQKDQSNASSEEKKLVVKLLEPISRKDLPGFVSIAADGSLYEVPSNSSAVKEKQFAPLAVDSSKDFYTFTAINHTPSLQSSLSNDINSNSLASSSSQALGKVFSNNIYPLTLLTVAALYTARSFVRAPKKGASLASSKQKKSLIKNTKLLDDSPLPTTPSSILDYRDAPTPTQTLVGRSRASSDSTMPESSTPSSSSDSPALSRSGASTPIREYSGAFTPEPGGSGATTPLLSRSSSVNLLPEFKVINKDEFIAGGEVSPLPTPPSSRGRGRRNSI